MPKKILLADDSLTIQKVVELTFSDSDYELVCVSNGERALEKVREDRPDLILADVVMPEKNGYEVCEAIKGDPATSRIPVVLLSGTFEPFDRSRAERIGADAIVSKPFDSQQLLAQVDALVARFPGSGGSRSAPSPIPQTTAAIAIPPPPPPPAAGAAAHDDPPFDVGFSAEDFTASVRLPPARTGIDPFEEEYVRGDVDSAIEAFEKAHPRFGFGSGLDSEGGLAAQPLVRPEPARRDEPGRDEPRREEPSWLREEPDRSPLGGGVAEEGRASESESAAPIEDEAATISVSRAQIPTVPMIPADQLPTVEMPRPSFDRPRRSPLATAGGADARDAATDADKTDRIDRAEVLFDAPPSESPSESPFETAVPAAAAPSTREISEQDASVLFDVAPPASASSASSEIHEPHPIEAPESEPRRSFLDAAPDRGERPAESFSGAGDSEERSAVESEPLAAAPTDRETAESSEVRFGNTEASPEEPAPRPEPAVASGDGDAHGAAVPGDIEMLAQRSSIPELTRMLSSMRSTGDITDEQLDRLAAKVVEKLSDKIVREIAWEVIPDMAEIVIRQRIKELEAGAE
jgi:CheY-like chemotaxis protein